MAFKSGVVKVGHAKDIVSRLQGYRKTGAVLGNPVTDTWHSPPDMNSRGNERILIRFCEERGQLASGGKRGEYFTGLSFESVQKFAQTLADRSEGSTPEAANARDQVTFSELINSPARVTSELHRKGSGLHIRRRDGEDLVLMAASQMEGAMEALETMAHLIGAISRLNSEGEELARVAVQAAYPWARHLPPDAQSEFLRELTDVTRAAAILGTVSPVAPVIASWKATAEVYSDPDLYRSLTRGSGED